MTMTKLTFLAALFTAMCTLASCNPTSAPVSADKNNDAVIRSIEDELKRDCTHLMQLFERSDNQEQFDQYQFQLDACARLLFASENGQLMQLGKISQPEQNRESELEKTATRKDEDETPSRAVSRRAYDYIRFGKRLSNEAENVKRMTSKNSNRKLGTHEYIRFGKK